VKRTTKQDSQREAESQDIEPRKAKRLTQEPSSQRRSVKAKPPKQEKRNERKRDEREEAQGRKKKTSSILNTGTTGKMGGYGIARATETGSRNAD
jgi:hypothetical protein